MFYSSIIFIFVHFNSTHLLLFDLGWKQDWKPLRSQDDAKEDTRYTTPKSAPLLVFVDFPLRYCQVTTKQLLCNYSCLPNRRRGTLIKFSENFQPLGSYSVPYVYWIWRKWTPNMIIPSYMFIRIGL